VRIFDCRCGGTIFFDNTLCLTCKRELGYLPDERTLSALEPSAAAEGRWLAVAARPSAAAYRKCSNYASEGVCNWMVPADDDSPFCASCRLNDTIPSLEQPGNRERWAQLEAAKRRLVYSLLALDLPLVAKSEDSANGLAFAFLADPSPTDSSGAPAQRVLTGHNAGTITINVAEADDIEREQARRHMNESYRTLLGHFRHESGHYYFTRLVDGTPVRDRFRALFGDETTPYEDALQRHYADGPPADWQTRFISAYASSHPAEDWAESWAHYLHMIDTIETSGAFGISSRDAADDIIDARLFAATDYGRQARADPRSFAALVREWVWLSIAINDVNRSMGMRDAYPFVLSKPIADKLQFVHQVIHAPRAH
jgi:hypothetical protein